MEVETQGAEGAKDVLSQQAIDEADVVIIAADIHVDPARFQNKHMHAVSTSDAIRKTKEIIEIALKEAEEFSAQAESSASDGGRKYIVGVTSCRQV